MSYFQRIRSRYFSVFGHTRILLMSRKYSGLHKMHSQDGEWHVHGEEMRRRAFARGNYERKFTDLWQILRQHSIQVDFRAPLFRVRSSLLHEKRRLKTWKRERERLWHSFIIIIHASDVIIINVIIYWYYYSAQIINKTKNYRFY